MAGQGEPSNCENVAQTIGLVPSLNKNDNLYQGIFVLIVTLICAGLGAATGGTNGLESHRELSFTISAASGAILGLVGSGLFSGAVLMVVGMVRVAKFKKASPQK